MEYSKDYYYNTENLENIEKSIYYLDSVNYFDVSDVPEEKELANRIEECQTLLWKILQKAKEYERRKFCEYNNINCSTCKNKNLVGEWCCDMCTEYQNWEPEKEQYYGGRENGKQ